MKTFILIIYMSRGYTGGPVVIQDIPSLEQCNALKVLIDDDFSQFERAKCYEVVKVKV